MILRAKITNVYEKITAWNQEYKLGLNLSGRREDGTSVWILGNCAYVAAVADEGWSEFLTERAKHTEPNEVARKAYNQLGEKFLVNNWLENFKPYSDEEARSHLEYVSRLKLESEEWEEYFEKSIVGIPEQIAKQWLAGKIPRRIKKIENLNPLEQCIIDVCKDLKERGNVITDEIIAAQLLLKKKLTNKQGEQYSREYINKVKNSLIRREFDI